MLLGSTPENRRQRTAFSHRRYHRCSSQIFVNLRKIGRRIFRLLDGEYSGDQSRRIEET